MNYLKLIRPLNLTIIVWVQCIIKYGFLSQLEVSTLLSDFTFLLLVVATVAIAAAGNVINDIQDVEIDKINKPKKVIVGKSVSEKAAFGLYIFLTILGVGVGFYLANHIQFPGLAALFIIISALLYVYATQLKSMLLVGNILISILVSMSLIVIILFDIFPAIYIEPSLLQIHSSTIILVYAVFAFYFNLVREIVKDIEDINGDKNGGRSTLPIVLGRNRTTNICFVLGVIGLLAVLSITYFKLYNYQTMAFYTVFMVGGPLLFFCIKAWDAEHGKDFKIMSIALKIVFVTGISSLLFIPEIL
ncbi:MAG: geranylgeranylglycerol-phosphate geranylgeranyltransferase [Flavobacteriaceae bacterium]|nr:geranylgeranylglycerol-phosphate geranylgeranyltransferase [Flavobacteriaceae bacterium]